MTYTIVGCGDSAKDWVPNGISIGVNDCWKFGKPTDYLVVVNSPLKFNPKTSNGFTNRLKTICDSTPKRFFCHDSTWRKWFKGAETLPMRTFNGKYVHQRVYSSKTSPFIAITLAVKLGATEIILWGVDMLTHHAFSPGKKDFQLEFEHYKILFDELKIHGVNVFIGNKETVLKDYLPVYDLREANI